MAKMTVSFSIENDVFAQDAGPEVARILRNIADQAICGVNSGSVFDANGNRVGEWEIEEEVVRDGRHLVDASHPLHSLNRDD